MARILASAALVIEGCVQRISLEKSDHAEVTIRVTRAVKGAVEGTITVLTMHGDQGANCGAASKFIRRFYAPVIFGAAPVEGKPGAYATNACLWIDHQRPAAARRSSGLEPNPCAGQ